MGLGTDRLLKKRNFFCSLFFWDLLSAIGMGIPSLCLHCCLCLHEEGGHMADMLHIWCLSWQGSMMMQINCMCEYLSMCDGGWVHAVWTRVQLTFLGWFEKVLLLKFLRRLSPVLSLSFVTSLSFYHFLCLSFSSLFNSLSSSDVPWLLFLHPFFYSWTFLFFNFVFFFISCTLQSMHTSFSSPGVLSFYWVFLSLFIAPSLINCTGDLSLTHAFITLFWRCLQSIFE